jgi:hypothetical protein
MSENHTDSQNTNGDIPTTNFWVTLPGVITAIGGLIGALTAAVVAIYPLINKDIQGDSTQKTQDPTLNSEELLFSGFWEGQGTRSNGSIFMVKLNLEKSQNTIDYPTFGCSGKLTLIEKQRKQVEFRENLNTGLNKCENFGRVVLRLQAKESAMFEWYDPTNRLVETAVLKK